MPYYSSRYLPYSGEVSGYESLSRTIQGLADQYAKRKQDEMVFALQQKQMEANIAGAESKSQEALLRTGFDIESARKVQAQKETEFQALQQQRILDEDARHRAELQQGLRYETIDLPQSQAEIVERQARQSLYGKQERELEKATQEMSIDDYASALTQFGPKDRDAVKRVLGKYFPQTATKARYDEWFFDPDRGLLRQQGGIESLMELDKKAEMIKLENYLDSDAERTGAPPNYSIYKSVSEQNPDWNIEVYLKYAEPVIDEETREIVTYYDENGKRQTQMRTYSVRLTPEDMKQLEANLPPINPATGKLQDVYKKLELHGVDRNRMVVDWRVSDKIKVSEEGIGINEKLKHTNELIQKVKSYAPNISPDEATNIAEKVIDGIIKEENIEVEVKRIMGQLQLPSLKDLTSSELEWKYTTKQISPGEYNAEMLRRAGKTTIRAIKTGITRPQSMGSYIPPVY